MPATPSTQPPSPLRWWSGSTDLQRQARGPGPHGPGPSCVRRRAPGSRVTRQQVGSGGAVTPPGAPAVHRLLIFSGGGRRLVAPRCGHANSDISAYLRRPRRSRAGGRRPGRPSGRGLRGPDRPPAHHRAAPRAGPRPQRLRARAPPARRARPRLHLGRGRRLARRRAALHRPRRAGSVEDPGEHLPRPAAAALPRERRRHLSAVAGIAAPADRRQERGHLDLAGNRAGARAIPRALQRRSGGPRPRAGGDRGDLGQQGPRGHAGCSRSAAPSTTAGSPTSGPACRPASCRS